MDNGFVHDAPLDRRDSCMIQMAFYTIVIILAFHTCRRSSDNQTCQKNEESRLKF